MKRRIFLALLLTAAACGASSARAQTQTVAPQVPPDRITLEEFKRLRAENKIFVLDVRIGIATKIKGAAYIPLDQLESPIGTPARPRDHHLLLLTAGAHQRPCGADTQRQRFQGARSLGRLPRLGRRGRRDRADKRSADERDAAADD